jgi:hypothetical protein
VVTARLQTAMIGQTVDADELVRLTEEAHHAAPSSATGGVLIFALIFRAHQTLLTDEPAYAEMASRALRSLGPGYLVAVAMSRDGALREAARANPDVKRASELAIEAGRRLPDERSPWDWALLQAAHSDVAAEIAQAVRQDKVRSLKLTIRLRLSPLSAAPAFDSYWTYQMAGKEDEAAEVLRRCAARGVPLPFDPK